MAGILFYYSKGQKLNLDTLQLLKENLEELEHRGNSICQNYQEHKWFLGAYTNIPQLPNNYLTCFQSKFNDRPCFAVIDGDILNKKEIIRNVLETESNGNSLNRALYQGFKINGIDFFKKLKGMYSLILGDFNEFVAIKDPVGFNPLYILESRDEIIVASELKAFIGLKGIPTILNPGTAYHYKDNAIKIEKFHRIDRFNEGNHIMQDLEKIKSNLFTLLDKSVKSAIPNTGKTCALLSGGIDSSVVCALAQKYISDLEVFTVATEESPDLGHARNFIEKYPNITHRIFKVKIEDLLEILPEVIYSLETFDAALIRSALPMYYICSKIDDKYDVLLTGEGGDELFGGYSYLKILILKS
ncbi:MAG: hypothetical protein GF364_18305 [Candidatus Lokiarchaeota archaeon]|nr:hypothetical protein [Candidatus Lokiarchaeota archaeon]